MRPTLWRLLLPVLILCLVAPAMVQAAAKEPQLRSVQGIVTDAQENPLTKAVVQLKNTKTLQVKSFYTDEKGSYRFHGLDPDVDYEVKAEYGNASSGPRKITSFDSRREVIINFKLDAAKQ